MDDIDTAKVTCPRTFHCDPPQASFDIGRAPSYVSLVSCSLSCLGSLLILLAYAGLKDMRTGAQAVVTLLALADFFTAFGYIIGGVNFLVHFNATDSRQCAVFEDVCTIQSFVTTWSTMASYSWTCILAFYFFLVIVYGKPQLASRLIPVYNCIAWIGPLTIMLPLLLRHKLGFAPYVASNWCYIKDNNYESKLSKHGKTIGLILVAGKLWEMMTYVFILVIYTLIKVHVRKTRRRIEEFDSATAPKVVQVEKRLLAIPLLYILLRMWGTLQFFYSLAVSNQNHMGCIPKAVRDVYYVLGILQAIGDGGQGWCNAILYVFLSKTVRTRLFRRSCKQCLQKLDQLLETDSVGQPRIPRHQYQYNGYTPSSETETLIKGRRTYNYHSTGIQVEGGSILDPKEVSLEQKSSGK